VKFGDHITLLAGQADGTGDLRRQLIQGGVQPWMSCQDWPGLRRWLLQGRCDLVTICVALTDDTLEVERESLTSFLNDIRSFPATVRAIGVLNGQRLNAVRASTGFDLYVPDAAAALEAIACVRRAILRPTVGLSGRRLLVDLAPDGSRRVVRPTRRLDDLDQPLL